MATTDRDGFYVAALRLLARDGPTAVRVTTLCAEIGVTTGSFHHWFSGREDFVDYLLARWEQEETVRLRDVAAAQPTADGRLDTLRRFALSFPHEAERSIRAWSHADPKVAIVQQRVDAARERAVHDALGEAVDDDQTRAVLAATAVSVLIGHQQRHHSHPDGELSRLFRELPRLLGLGEGRHADSS